MKLRPLCSGNLRGVFWYKFVTLTLPNVWRFIEEVMLTITTLTARDRALPASVWKGLEVIGLEVLGVRVRNVGMLTLVDGYIWVNVGFDMLLAV